MRVLTDLMDQIAPTPLDPKDEQKEIHDRPFNPHRFASSENTRAIVEEAIGLLLNCEAYFGLRQNKRRPKDQKTFNLTVDAILSDLMHHHLSEEEGGVYVTRSNRVLGTRSRYRPTAFSKMFPYILDLMAKPEMAYVAQDVAPPGQDAGRSTVIRPGSKLLSRIEEHQIGIDDVDEHPHSEIVILKRTKDPDDYWDEGGLEEYEDTVTTELFRHQLEGINEWLASADLRFDPTGVPWPHTDFSTRERRLRRVFTQGRFDSGGRLFGGFWQRLHKNERRRGLWISGERAVELDYGQAGPRILYGMAGHQPPNDDLYRIWGYTQQRDGIKRVMNAMIFADGPLDRFPKFTRKLFRQSDKIGEVVEAIEAQHPLIQDHFHRGLGHEVQFIESQIMVEILLILKFESVVALPIHDAVMVPISKAALTREVMIEAFRKHGHVEGVVEIVPLEEDVCGIPSSPSPIQVSPSLTLRGTRD